MRIKKLRMAGVFLIFPLFVFFSCTGEKPVEWTVSGTNARLMADSKTAAAGILDFNKPRTLGYNFEGGARIRPPASVEIEYSFSVLPSPDIKKYFQLIFENESESWALPTDYEFAGIAMDGGSGAVFHYAIPLNNSPLRKFSVSLIPVSDNSMNANKRPLPVFQIHSLEIKERWFGFRRINSADGGHFYASPFVYKNRAAGQSGFVIDPPASAGLMLAIDMDAGMNSVVINKGGRLELMPGAATLIVPGFFSPGGVFPIEISGAGEGFGITLADVPQFPLPLSVDPGIMLQWPVENWRDARFEVFRWDRFPSLLIFDTADYAVQDKLFKRLSFFVEKAGFMGRLASDAEIAGLHGWNAHDYKAEDLAAFFEAARISNFPLLPEERELLGILLNEGIICRDSNGLSSGDGGVISISRGSQDYLRSLFLAHEGFHGLFFIDEDFRNFCTERWFSLPSRGRAFITSYFDYQHYNINDEYLMINEFMAHVLQQPVSRAAAYFGETLPRRLESSSWRSSALGGKDSLSNSWPELAGIFARESQAFSDYVRRRWGLSGGRVWLVNVSR